MSYFDIGLARDCENMSHEIKKLQEQNKELLELLKKADSLVDDYLNWRDEKRMDYFDIRARKLREALAKVRNMGDGDGF